MPGEKQPSPPLKDGPSSKGGDGYRLSGGLSGGSARDGSLQHESQGPGRSSLGAPLERQHQRYRRDKKCWDTPPELPEQILEQIGNWQGPGACSEHPRYQSSS